MISQFWIFVDTVQRRTRERKAAAPSLDCYKLTRVFAIAIADGRTTITIQPFEEDYAADMQIESVSYATEPEDAERAATDAPTLYVGKVKIPARVAADLNAREDAIDRRLYKRATKKKQDRKHVERVFVRENGAAKFEQWTPKALEVAARKAVKESEKK